MANNTSNLSPDVYGIHDYIENIKKEFIAEVGEDTLMLGIFGYTGEVAANALQNSIVMASEFSNESIPTRAKFEKNIIAHALGLGIDDINAVPAEMKVQLFFIEDDIQNWYDPLDKTSENGWTFVFDKDNKIMFGDFEFHTDYDIIIKKIPITTKGNKIKFAYTAQYKQEDIDRGNPIIKDTNPNPYLAPPVVLHLEGLNMLIVTCNIHQVTKTVYHTKVLSDNDVSAKTITFPFEGDLAGFDMIVTEGENEYHMVPVYEGLNVDTGGKLYFWYTYLDTNTIRIKFDKNSYIPSVNASVEITIQTTAGSRGNFNYDRSVGYPSFNFSSERLDYSNIECQVRPVNDMSAYGTDKKTIAELKQMIPRAALARGAITTTKDLENMFNSFETDLSKIYFYKKRDSCLERLYYAFMIMKDALNIVPTNTVNLLVKPDELETEEGSGKLILKQGRAIVLEPGSNEARILGKGEVLPDQNMLSYDGTFTYYLPYDFIINQSPLYGMYIMTTMHANKDLDFYFINESCIYQYISTYLSWDRNCLEEHNVYNLNMEVQQNVSSDSEEDADAPIHKDDEGNLVNGVEVYMIIYNEDGNPLRWAKAECTEVISEDPITLNYNFKFTTEDKIDIYNRIRVDTGLYDIGTNNESYAHLNANMQARIFIVSKQDKEYGLGDPALSKYIPGLEGKSLSNTYEVLNGLDFFYDYSSIVTSTVTVSKNEDESIDYHVIGVPVVKYGYIENEEVAKSFFGELVTRKTYIDDAVKVLEDAFEMDFKFFNTYGPSKFFTWDNSEDVIDRVNVSLFFKLRLKPNYDTNIVEDIRQSVKEYVEDINSIRDLHIPNLITKIESEFSDSLVFFEFVSINGKDPSYQHIYAMDVPDGIMVPEFVNINTLADGVPDINIELV